MMKDVIIWIKKNLAFLLIILFLANTFTGCEKKEKIYLDYNEVETHANSKLRSLKNDNSFLVFNESDTIHLSFGNSENEKKSYTYLRKIQISPLDSAIKRLGKISIDNFHSEKARGLPEIFIVKVDSAHKKIEIIEVNQAFSISDHKAVQPGWEN